MNIFKYIGYAFKAKKGINHTDEFVADISFGPIESLFMISFIILGLVTLGLGFIAFYYVSNIALIFALLFLLALSVDIFIFIKIRRFFSRLSKKAVNFSKQKYKKFTHGNDETIIDVEYE